MLYRNRVALREIRRIELEQQGAHAVAKLQADGAPTAEEATEIMAKADAAYESTNQVYEEQRAALPSALRKLTAGYEMRTYGFEIFECVRKLSLIGLPIFFEPGTPGQVRASHEHALEEARRPVAILSLSLGSCVADIPSR